MDLQDRVVDLESRLAFLDDTINTLNEVLVDQQRQIDRLTFRIESLNKRHDELAGQMDGVAVVDAPPPHY